MAKSTAIEIVPGKSIGSVQLGMKIDALPRHAVVQPPAGSLDGVQFVINQAGVVEDIWIDDLRVFPDAVSCAGKEVPRDVTLDGLSELFGECERVAGVKGGLFFNCANGLAIGTDFAHQILQVRVKPMPSGG